MEPVLAVLLLAAGAALVSVLGVVPLLGRGPVPARWIGWADALAAGGMLGAAWVLSDAERTLPLAAAGGAALGIVLVAWTHEMTGAATIELNRPHEDDRSYGYRIVLIHGLHSAWEGLAIGAAMAVDLALGAFVAAVMAVHNIPEATVLGSVSRGRGGSLPAAAGLGLASNLPQVVLAVAVFAVADVAPVAQPWLQGFAIGALLDLTIVELLPGSYRDAGPTSIALVASVALSLVVLMRGAIAG